MNTRVISSPFSRSLTLHLLLLLMLIAYAIYSPKIKTSDEPITISLLDPPKTPEKDSSQRRIVQPSEGELAKDAKKNAYLSDKTRVTKEERSATKSGSTLPSAQPKVAQQAKAKPISVADLGIKIPTTQAQPNEKPDHWAPNALGEAVHGGEYIKGMKEGESSALNTKEFVFFSYFERMRRQMYQTWAPMVRSNVEKLYKTGRHLASQSEFTTSTIFTISSKGEILRVQLLQESGAIDIDDAAVNALNKAGPYPNPPKGLLDADGTAHIRWDFVLKT